MFSIYTPGFMRFILLVSFLTSISFYSYAQQEKINKLVFETKRTSLEEYSFDESTPSITIESGFSSDSILATSIDSITVIKVDYVYSKFRANENFNQQTLDKQRFEKLSEALPGIYKNSLIQWNLIEQTGCRSLKECNDLFHGFVIYYRENPTEESRLEEITELETALEKMDSLIASDTITVPHISFSYRTCSYPKLRKTPFEIARRFNDKFSNKRGLKGKYKILYEVDSRGKILNLTIEGMKSANKDNLIKYFKKYIGFTPAAFMGKKYGGTITGTISFPLNRRSFIFQGFQFPEHITKHYTFDKTKKYECLSCRTDTTYLQNGMVMNNEISTILNRNKNWAMDLVVVDVTGSMMPYTADLMTWLRLNTMTAPKQFVFFNDGDRKTDFSKKIGNTGGIYQVKTGDFKEVKSTLLTSMKNGFGGDCPENNFEAFLEARKFCPECTDAVMVADNYAFPRDPSLLKTYKGKLKIILCGTGLGINVEYLNLARKYKFSIHTMKNDLLNLFELNEGQKVDIDGNVYIIKNGKFERVMGT